MVWLWPLVPNRKFSPYMPFNGSNHTAWKPTLKLECCSKATIKSTPSPIFLLLWPPLCQSINPYYYHILKLKSEQYINNSMATSHIYFIFLLYKRIKIYGLSQKYSVQCDWISKKGCRLHLKLFLPPTKMSLK